MYIDDSNRANFQFGQSHDSLTLILDEASGVNSARPSFLEPLASSSTLKTTENFL